MTPLDRLQKIENGEIDPTISEVKRISKALKIPPWALMFEHELSNEQMRMILDFTFLLENKPKGYYEGVQCLLKNATMN